MYKPSAPHGFLPTEEHEHACEALLEALKVHIQRFRRSAEEKCSVKEDGKHQIQDLRKQNGSMFSSKAKRKEAPKKAHEIRREIRNQIQVYVSEMKYSLVQISFFQSLLEDQFLRTEKQYPTIVDMYRKSYADVSQLLTMPLQPILSAATNAPRVEQLFLKTWLEIRHRLMQTFQAGKFSLPSLEDLGFYIQNQRSMDFAL